MGYGISKVSVLMKMTPHYNPPFLVKVALLACLLLIGTARHRGIMQYMPFKSQSQHKAPALLDGRQISESIKAGTPTAAR